VDRHIRRLRIKLQNDYRHPRFIATVPGLGYRFVPTFTNTGWDGELIPGECPRNEASPDLRDSRGTVGGTGEATGACRRPGEMTDLHDAAALRQDTRVRERR
jgi:Transcriptional regulatory protein, C terminal